MKLFANRYLSIVEKSIYIDLKQMTQDLKSERSPRAALKNCKTCCKIDSYRFLVELCSSLSIFIDLEKRGNIAKEIHSLGKALINCEISQKKKKRIAKSIFIEHITLAAREAYLPNRYLSSLGKRGKI